MNDNTHTIKHLITGLVLATALAALAVPQALAGSNSRYGAPDGWYPHAVSLTKASHAAVLDGRSPDTKDAGFTAQQQALAPVDGRSPDTLDAAQTAQAGLLVPADGRSPDTIDAAVQSHLPVVSVIRSAGFEWGDFGIGVAAAFGLMLLLGMSIRLLTGRQGRKQPSPVATA